MHLWTQKKWFPDHSHIFHLFATPQPCQPLTNPVLTCLGTLSMTCLPNFIRNGFSFHSPRYINLFFVPPFAPSSTLIIYSSTLNPQEPLINLFNQPPLYNHTMSLHCTYSCSGFFRWEMAWDSTGDTKALWESSGIGTSSLGFVYLHFLSWNATRISSHCIIKPSPASLI